MRVMVLVKASAVSEVGELPSPDFIARMNRFNEALMEEGVLLAADGLRPSAHGKRVRFDSQRRTVIEGPFAHEHELVSGFWLWEVSSMDEAVSWLSRAPFDGGAEVEIRPIFEPEDFAAILAAT